MRFRVAIYSLLLIALSWFQFGQDSSASAMTQRTADLFEKRPTITVLILGNSRTFFNDMPGMLRHLAKEPESPINIEVESSTAPGLTFEDHWKLGRSRRLLDKSWSYVLFQGESGAQWSRDQNDLYQAYGQKLARVAKVTSGRPTLLVNWPYDPSEFKKYEQFDGWGRQDIMQWIAKIHMQLAHDGNMDRLKLADLWEDVRVRYPSIPLTSDGNHPTVAGSYLYALSVYKFTTKQPVTSLSYVPKGLDPAVASTLRKEVDAASLG
jgi:hypothetical protein